MPNTKGKQKRWFDRITKRDAEWVGANNFVGLAMSRFKRGRLHSGGSGKVVKNPAQAIAIALSMQERYARAGRKVKSLPPSGFKSRRSGQDNAILGGPHFRRLGGI